jgi:hypothetical protein
MDVPPGGAAVPDIRAGGAGGLNFNLLRDATWRARTNLDRFLRPPAVNNTGLNNAQLPAIDVAIGQYGSSVANWEAANAQGQLNQVINAATAWLAANNHNPPAEWYDILGKRRNDRYTAARQTIQTLLAEAQQHHAVWASPANQNPPATMERLYRNANAAVPTWDTAHPIAGGGKNTYASILEIVTRPYEPETPPGRASLIAAITEAHQLAQLIENGTANFANRILFNTIAGTNILNPLTHVGNAGPTRNPQSTNASIQSTFGVDLAQIPSLIKTMYGVGTQGIVDLKHQADVQNPDDSWDRRSRTELMAAVADATAIINLIKVQPPYGAHNPAPSFVNLRGLITLICQYLRMGKHWSDGAAGSLDKNLTDILSRTNLSYIYRDVVPAAEKTWITAAAANRNLLIAQIFARTGRMPDSTLFNEPTTENLAHQFLPSRITCRQFTTNVLTQTQDGVTEHLGGFQRRPVEDIDPLASRAGDTRRPAAAHREGPVFEMRNMVPKGINAAERYPRAAWVPLATYMVNMIALLNARTEAQAASDARVRQNPNPAIVVEPNPW